MRRLLIGLFIASLCGACGLSYTVQRSLARQLSAEGRLALFAAENELIEAYDERAARRRQVRGVRDAQRAAEAELEEAISDTERARKKGQSDAVQVGQLAQAAANAKMVWLERAMVLARARLSAHDPVMHLARSRYELRKAQLVTGEKLEGSADIEVGDFEAQVQRYEKEVEKAETELTPLREGSARARESWSQAREALFAAAGGGPGSPWIDDSIVWWEE